MTTLELTPITWDWMVDSNGNWDVAIGPAAVAQDVASAISTFLGEVYYNTTVGLPWLSEVFAEPENPALLTALLVQAALTVPTVVSAKVTSITRVGGKVSGVLEFIDTTGVAQGVSF